MRSGWLKNWFESQKQTRKFHPFWIVLVVTATLAVGGVVWVSTYLFKVEEVPAVPAVLSSATPGQARSQTGKLPATTKPSPLSVEQGGDFSPPDPEDIPAGEFGDVIRLGKNIFTDTQTYASAYVGNGLNCVNCHLDAGRKPDSAPLWAAYGMFPAYREKNKQVNSYEDRLAGCFRFSMNGKAPPLGGKEMVALTSYSYWLAKGAPIGVTLKGRGYPKLDQPTLAPDEVRGKVVFEANCAICHGADGQGTQVKGRFVFPPLWGSQSFNAGAGMSKINNAAGFIKANMPLGQGGSLSLQDAWDVAKFMTSHERPADPRLAKK